jgi:ATP-binding cassette subfamily B (MDR/TAP) protein 1
MNETDVWREDETSDARSISGINGDIEFDAVNFIYPSRKDVSVLRNLSLIAREGQTTALVGSSGCGQSLRK